MHASLKEIAALIDGTLIGDGSIIISSLSPIDNIMPNALIFAEGEDNIKKANDSNASAILLTKPIEGMTKPIIKVPEPFKAFIQLLHHFHPKKPPQLGIHPTAVIAEQVQMGKNVSIGAYVVIGENSII
ncbi:MAG: LpxD N-terminal domain-containing protein, partial [Legionellaceae bacterium]